jgi:hypothetical protein
MPADSLASFAKEGLSVTVNLITKKEERSGNVLPKQETLWLGAVVLQKEAATQGMTLPLCTVLSQGQGKQGYTDSSRDRNRSGSCERSDNDYNTIKLTKIHYKEERQHPQLRSCSPLLFTKEHIGTRQKLTNREFGVRNSYIIMSVDPSSCFVEIIAIGPNNGSSSINNALAFFSHSFCSVVNVYSFPWEVPFTFFVYNNFDRKGWTFTR